MFNRKMLILWKLFHFFFYSVVIFVWYFIFRFSLRCSIFDSPIAIHFRAAYNFAHHIQITPMAFCVPPPVPINLSRSIQDHEFYLAEEKKAMDFFSHFRWIFSSIRAVGEITDSNQFHTKLIYIALKWIILSKKIFFFMKCIECFTKFTCQNGDDDWLNGQNYRKKFNENFLPF